MLFLTASSKVSSDDDWSCIERNDDDWSCIEKSNDDDWSCIEKA